MVEKLGSRNTKQRQMRALGRWNKLIARLVDRDAAPQAKPGKAKALGALERWRLLIGLARRQAWKVAALRGRCRLAYLGRRLL